jgi:nitronate monooxygenase
MLESERAGAKALVVYMGSFERNSEPWKILRAIQADEAHNCALIGKLIEKAGGAYSHATGQFYDKAVAVTGTREQVEYLARGLKWAVTKFEAELPRLDREAQDLFGRMRDSHVRSIAACENLVKTL